MYPGVTFQVSVVAISIIEQVLNPAHLPGSQHLQQVNNMCTKLNYTVLSLSQYVNMQLNVEDVQVTHSHLV